VSLQTFDHIEQGTEAWHDLRRGIVTASVVGKLLTFESPNALTVDCPKCKASAGSNCISLARKTPTPISTFHPERTAVTATLPPELAVANNDTSRALTATLAAERVAGFTEDTPLSRDMYRGVWSEPFARDLYSGHYQQAVEVGFMRRDEDGWTLGYSPDGLVGDVGLIEIKAPRSKTQLLTVVSDEVPAHYMAQCQAGLLVSGRRWLDFVSYVGGMHIYVKRVLPDPAWFAAIEAACCTFETNAAALVDTYTKRVDGLPVAPRIDFDLEVI
jgi:phage FluMu protein Com